MEPNLPFANFPAKLQRTPKANNFARLDKRENAAEEKILDGVFDETQTVRFAAALTACITKFRPARASALVDLIQRLP